MFGEWRFAHRRVSLFGRYDQFDDTRVIEGDPRKRVIAGVAYRLENRSAILLDYDIEGRNGFATTAQKTLKFSVEFGF